MNKLVKTGSRIVTLTSAMLIGINLSCEVKADATLTDTTNKSKNSSFADLKDYNLVFDSDNNGKITELVNKTLQNAQSLSTKDKSKIVKTEALRQKIVSKKESLKKTIHLTHNAFVYNKQGKAIRSGLNFKLLKRGKTFKNAKIATIKGNNFYQVGKNEFVKVANAKLTTSAVNVKTSVKGNIALVNLIIIT
ncbi:SLAP domain-containing protein [Lactobacillus intestinalis]|uniref:S-layer protein C-terminal domain-containing protein n=1 Tax=Lactobacillus intestinalis DSM 6629 TaxID=1423761 RepID=A0ABR5PR95_9LACO|nr:SLAP domain-containing protein [Lactobacillus intestinalis]KRM33955.1 hypothetical protein FC44_GL000634 [Lactobacillus intestinalis DSM 6629]